MVNFAPLVVLAASLTVIASPMEKRTVAAVETDLGFISGNVTSLNNAINAFTAPNNLVAALNIHSGAVALEAAITQGTKDVVATGPVSEADATTIINLVKGIQPGIISALTNIVTKKPLFDNTTVISGLGSIVKSDLNTLNSDTSAFETALVNAAPADLKANATTIVTAINSAFAAAVSAYASEK
ncbi:hypothetical protein M422DRAFT_51113 [Sphaerobolus stellatus SS14]|uniref:Hydrophobic surface binding protein n=1 Tax=Sphaerobolus stellatus (strain SS14) TaxID=990650 RepID=A0A0C9VFG8_SPHS4|nr:hypothetical protein M422DRAFT_51113 [Sphaerobolus stellatus SS14]